MARAGRIDVIKRIRAENNLTEKQAGEVLTTVLNAMEDIPKTNEMLVLPKFGTFRMRHRKASRTNNPRTGEPMIVPAMDILHFRASRLKR